MSEVSSAMLAPLLKAFSTKAPTSREARRDPGEGQNVVTQWSSPARAVLGSKYRHVRQSGQLAEAKVLASQMFDGRRSIINGGLETHLFET
jgi:hypothetical protein